MPLFASSSLSVFPNAVDWMVATLLGSVATGIAVLAVAFLGVGMLAGRLDWRTATRVVLGIFILFGAPVIVQGLMSAVGGDRVAMPDAAVPGPAPGAPKVPEQKRLPDPFDPYAGAAVRN